VQQDATIQDTAYSVSDVLEFSAGESEEVIFSGIGNHIVQFHAAVF
jgi:hypothetical protein